MPVSFSESFADPSGLAAATVAGHVEITADNPYRGDACLRLSRSREMMEREETSVAFPTFPVRDGLWDVSLAMRAALYSPDSSYSGTTRLLVYDAAGEVIEKHELATVMGDRAWTASRKRLELPAEAVSARFTATMEKTWGEFAVDMLAAEFAGPSLRTVTAIMFASEAVGNLFEPERPLRFDVSAVCRRERPEAERKVTCTVRDYWGAEYDTRTIALPTAGTNDTGRPVYSGVLDLTDLAVAQGKYYEIHATMSEPDLPEPAHDFSSFAVLPIAVTKQHPPFDVPFTASGWNPGVPGFFPLCDRLGMRVANVYSRWSSEPPYAHTAPGIEIVKELGMGALLGTPVNRVERRLPGWEAYDETAMYEGARGLIAAYKDELPIALRVGNEPHPIDDDDVRRMIRTYKAVYQGAKAADPTVTVTATSCSAEEQFFRLGYQDWHDVYIFHTYADAQVVRGHFAEYYSLADKYGVRKPVWSTELGLNSNGMSRDAVATQLIKLMTNFFACGGVNASWFGIMWPDPEGRLVGTNGDSFDVFFSKYCLYSPKLTGVTEYHFVNAICIKKFVDQRSYPTGEMLTLFRDKNDRCLIVAWNDTARRATCLPLPGVGAVQTTRLDGSGGSYVATDGGLTLALSDEPYLIAFASADLALPESLGEPAAALAGEIAPMVKGGTTRVELRCPGVDPETVTLEAPPQWQVERQTTATGASFTVTAPTVTAAYEGRLVAHLGETVGELELPVRVDDALAVRFVPAPFTEAGAGMCVELTNRGALPQQVQWSVTMPECYIMDGGRFALKEPVPFAPVFSDAATGEVELSPGASTRCEVRAVNIDPLRLYNARLELSCDGRVRSQERLFGGCVGVPRVQGGVTFDGKMGDPAWAQAPVLHLDQPGQVAFITRKTAKWDGPDDLSGAMHFLWDDEYLYLGMKVRDSVYCNPEVGNLIYRGDSLQFLIDPCRETSQKPGRYDYIVALTRDGVQAWCHSSADAAKAPSREVYDFKLQVTPTGERGDMVYEVAIPWHRVSPFVPVPGGTLGLGMIINNDDGQIRDSFIAWFGCAHSKQLSMNGDLILLP